MTDHSNEPVGWAHISAGGLVQPYTSRRWADLARKFMGGRVAPLFLDPSEDGEAR